MFRFLPFLTLALILGPVAAGLLGTVFPAFGHYPPAGFTGPTLDPFRALISWPGLESAVRLSITTGVLATLLSLAIVSMLVAGWSGTKAFQVLETLLSPLLSVPHAAAAFGLAFLIAPSGWLVRFFTPWLTGWSTPPDVLIVQDPLGLAMVAGLVVKEVPFLLLMTLAAQRQGQIGQRMTIARSLGYGRIVGWLKSSFPMIYQQIRLPVYVVLAYSMSVVDVAIILGPNTPSTLSVQVVKWANSPDIALRMQAAAAALLQLGLVVVALLGWHFGERCVAKLGQYWVYSGSRGIKDKAARAISLSFGLTSAAAVLIGIAGLLVWSFAGYWSFPDALPQEMNFKTWMRHAPGLASSFSITALVALLATSAALLLTIGCLEAEGRTQRPLSSRGIWLLYLPLLIPQTAFLPGLQVLLIWAGASHGIWPVVLTHLVFVLPYVFLSLSGPFRAWDSRYGNAAQALGATPNKVLLSVRLPMLLQAVLTAYAVGIAVSVGQYLPTLMMGGGRVASLTTEALALASGGDRRAIGVYSLAQAAAALLPFAFAIGLPTLIWRHRAGMKNV